MKNNRLEERFGQNCPLQAKRIAAVSVILVLPETSPQKYRKEHKIPQTVCGRGTIPTGTIPLLGEQIDSWYFTAKDSARSLHTTTYSRPRNARSIQTHSCHIAVFDSFRHLSNASEACRDPVKEAAVSKCKKPPNIHFQAFSRLLLVPDCRAEPTVTSCARNLPYWNFS